MADENASHVTQDDPWDLSGRIRRLDSLPVSYGGYASVYKGELAMGDCGIPVVGKSRRCQRFRDYDHILSSYTR